jgi:hypothetical protein
MIVSDLLDFELYDNTAGKGHPIPETFWTQCAAFCGSTYFPCKSWWLFQSSDSNEVTCFAGGENPVLEAWEGYHDLVAELV